MLRREVIYRNDEIPNTDCEALNLKTTLIFNCLVANNTRCLQVVTPI